jgi:acetylornithine/succinyldiaminopimelate/putrescine aminotransferase
MITRHGAATGRPYLLAFSGAFHGKTTGAALAGDVGRYKDALLVARATKVLRAPYPEDRHTENQVMQLISRSKRKIGALILECIQGTTMRAVKPSFLKWAERWCVENDALLVIDEIQTGFYRSGIKFAYHSSKANPDILLLGKGLTSSLALSTVMVNERARRYWNAAVDLSTHAGNPLAVAACSACLDIYESSRFLKTMRRNSAAFKRCLQKMQLIRGPFEIIIHHGLYGAVRFKPGVPTENVQGFVEACEKRGLLLPGAVGRDNRIVKLTPPLTIPVPDLRKGCSIVSMSLRETASMMVQMIRRKGADQSLATDLFVRAIKDAHSDKFSNSIRA